VRVEILGCSGGFAKEHDTTSALIDGDVLLDAGTGVGRLSHKKMSAVRSVLLSHSHLDHVASMCFLIDYNIDFMEEPTSVYCLPHTAKMIRENLINGQLWPDIESVQNKGVNLLEINEIKPYRDFVVRGKTFTALPVNHVVPTVSYAMHGPKSKFVYVSDMIDAEPKFWKWMNAQDDISHVVLECSFPSHMRRIAEISKHLTPALLKEQLRNLKPPKKMPKIFVSHIKPYFEREIRREIKKEFPDGSVVPLEAGMKFVI